MCGIVGCIVKEQAGRVLASGLERLEYRGYDSAGIAVVTDDGIRVRRRVGKLAELLDDFDYDAFDGKVGIGHTRWATHGKPSEGNAHPIQDDTGDVVLVHNGIIENYKEIREELEGKGHVFATETDTEVIAHLISEIMQGDDLEGAVRETMRRLKGAYAIVVLHRRLPDRLVGARRDSPLVAGIGEGEYFLASDIPPLLEHTRDVLLLEDGEIVSLTPEGVRVTDLEGNTIERQPKEIEWNLLQAEKGGYPHFMLKEIHEQGVVVNDSLLGRIAEDGTVRLPELDMDADAVAAIDKIVIIGCGTSWHSALIGKFLIEELAEIPVEVDIGSEFRYRRSILGPSTLVLAITQSGETADTLASMRKARAHGARTISICNVIGSTASREADGVVYTQAGPEIGVASTKAFVSQLIVLNLLALHLGSMRGKITREASKEYTDELRAVRGRVETLIERADELDPIVDSYKHVDDFLYLGRGINYPIALEGALKLKEISYIHAEGYPAGELKHGPIALIEEKMPVLAVATPGETYAKISSNIDQVKARGGEVIAVVADDEANPPMGVDHLIRVPRCRETISPIVNVVPLQILSYRIAVARGCDVDQPRNLAKSVTVE